MEKLKTYSLMLTALLALCSAGYFWWTGNHKPVVPQTNFSTAPENKKAKNVSKEKIKAEVPIEIFNKEEIAKQLKIQDPDKSNPKIQYTDAKTIPASEHDTSVVAKWDTEQGKITIDSRQEPLSLFEFENKREWEIKAGPSTEGGIKATLNIKQNFLRVKKVHIGGFVEGGGQFFDNSKAVNDPFVWGGIVLGGTSN